MTNENQELRYLVQAGTEVGDDVKKSIVSEMVKEGDMCVTVSHLYNTLDHSERTIRRHISQSELIYRDTSQGVVLVDVIDQLAEKALRVAKSADDHNKSSGLPEGDDL
jgi:hypothetical protein